MSMITSAGLRSQRDKEYFASKIESVNITTFLCVIMFVLLTTSSVVAQSSSTLARRLDSLAEWGVRENHAVGMVTAVVKNDDTLLFKAYGKADIEWEVPMSVNAMFELGSATKQFTAVAILKLRDRGALSLEDEITKWLPDFDTRGNTVTLRRLLDHTSGIADFTELPEFSTLMSNRVFPRDSAYVLIKRNPFQFKPGELQIYNNSAFWLLGMVIEKVSVMTYEDYVEKEIFEPLGMNSSMYCNSSENIPHRAHGYFIRRNGIIHRSPTNVHTWPFSAGSLCSTVGDMLKWLRALHGGEVLSPESYAQLITPSTLNDGTQLRYSMGLQVGPDPLGLQYIGHGGRIPGFWVEAGWYPDAQMAVVVMMNNVGRLDPQEVTSDLAAEVLGWTPSKPKRFTGDPSPLVGTYVGTGRSRDEIVRIEVVETPKGIAFSREGSPPRPFPWVEGLTFRVGQMMFTFRRENGDSGPVTELRQSRPGAHFILKKQ